MKITFDFDRPKGFQRTEEMVESVPRVGEVVIFDNKPSPVWVVRSVGHFVPPSESAGAVVVVLWSQAEHERFIYGRSQPQ